MKSQSVGFLASVVTLITAIAAIYCQVTVVSFVIAQLLLSPECFFTLITLKFNLGMFIIHVTIQQLLGPPTPLGILWVIFINIVTVAAFHARKLKRAAVKLLVQLHTISPVCYVTALVAVENLQLVFVEQLFMLPHVSSTRTNIITKSTFL